MWYLTCSEEEALGIIWPVTTKCFTLYTDKVLDYSRKFGCWVKGRRSNLQNNTTANRRSIVKEGRSGVRHSLNPWVKPYVSSMSPIIGQACWIATKPLLDRKSTIEGSQPRKNILRTHTSLRMDQGIANLPSPWRQPERVNLCNK